MKKNLSPVFKLTNDDVKKVAVGACMAALGALLTYLLEYAGTVDFGEYQTIAAALIAMVANLVRKWITETKY